MNNRFQTYKKVNVQTTNRGKIVVMLYSGAITFLKKAIKASENNNFYDKGRFINKTQDIIDELNYSLDMEKGKEISKNLRSIYIFLTKYLSQANIKNDPEMIKKVIDILESLKTAFEEIITNPKYEEAQKINKREQTQHSIRRFV
ncbi:MAG: flagellar export chaperone FliS [Candidatus Cloacimonadota bacterium]|nr:MAG: flagellar export chaperone FliS [Candidatus Cloacimonadota bacterium]